MPKLETFHFSPKTYAVLSIIPVICCANYLYFSEPDTIHLAGRLKSCSGYICGFLCCSRSHVCSNSSIALFCPNVIFPHNTLDGFSIGAFHFEEHAGNLLDSLECLYIIIKVTFDSNMLPLQSETIS